MLILPGRAVFLSYEIMMQCWSEDPDERPTFDELNTIFKEFMNLEVKSLLIFPSTTVMAVVQRDEVVDRKP